MRCIAVFRFSMSSLFMGFCVYDCGAALRDGGGHQNTQNASFYKMLLGFLHIHIAITSVVGLKWNFINSSKYIEDLFILLSCLSHHSQATPLPGSPSSSSPKTQPASNILFLVLSPSSGPLHHPPLR